METLIPLTGAQRTLLANNGCINHADNATHIEVVTRRSGHSYVNLVLCNNHGSYTVGYIRNAPLSPSDSHPIEALGCRPS